MSEYQILRAAVSMQAWIALVLFLFGSGVILVSALRHVIDMVYGEARIEAAADSDGFGMTAMVGIALASLLVLGVWLPQPLAAIIRQAAAVVASNP